ncbi:KIF18A [Symbiodinium necroappetens]|uniref:Kinesin-like protein n=1 Tax=Symbiodinium necroappetens TaxID=1628268 RepID=A0A812K3E4_9DINO|nr:KIF18A [Symbiodinium necroappetens]
MGSGASSASDHGDLPASTERMFLEPQDMEDADAFFRGDTFSEDEKLLFSRIVGYVAKTSLGGMEYTMPLRCLQAAEAEASESRVALCLHGFGDDRCMALWTHFWLPMTEKGFHVVALDLPGFGRASGRPGKDWSAVDGELLLRLMECLRMRDGRVSVFAEGIGACAFLRAYAQDSAPFAGHHVLLNVQIGEVPKGLRENLESRGADIMLCGCEKFYPTQPPWMLSGLNQLSQLLLDPSTMGQLGTFVLWKVKNADGPTPIKSMRDGTWWTGNLEKTALAKAGHALVFRASADCFRELFDYVAAPPRKVIVKTALQGPEMTSIETGEINDTFSVFIRIRPLLERELKAGSENCLAVSDTDFPRDPPPQRIVVQAGDANLKGSYVFNRVFEQSMSQEAVFNSTAKPFVQDFLAGTNVTIFAYGQTGTGKTYTIFGPAEDPGIVTRSLSDIFEKMPAGKELHYEYVQLYLDDFKDLLADASGLGKLVEGKAGVELLGLSSHKATSASEILQAVAKGATRRATRAQDMNEVSSRSHAILMLRLKEGDGGDVFSSMFIVDLAGSERVARSGVTGDGFTEATNVNLSLTALGRVVMSLIEADITQTKAFIPYNASPLTMLLKAGLGGNSKTALVACVTQAADSLSESVSTLRFAMQASHVKNKVEQKEAQDRADQEKTKIAEAAHELRLSGGKGSVELTSGSIEIWGTWQSAAEETVILLGGLGSELEQLEGLITALRDIGRQVLAPKLPGTAEKHLDADVSILLELLDWLGLAKPAFYGRDWGAVRAVRFKMAHPKRSGNLVLENRLNKMSEAQYKAKMKKDPNYALQEYMGPWLWFFDGTFPKSLDGSGIGNNVKGFKGNVLFLWPYHTKGRHDPPKRVTTCSKVADVYAKAVKTKPVDSYLMTDADIASRIVGFAE